MKLNRHCGKMLVAAIALAASSGYAQTVAIGSATVAPGGTAAIPVTFTPGAQDVGGITLNFTFTRPPAVANGLVTFTAGTATCGGPGTSNPTGTQLNVGRASVTALGAETLCTFNIPIDAAAAEGTFPFVVAFTEYSDPAGNEIMNVTTTAGSITVAAGPGNVPPTLAYMPAPGQTVVFPGAGGQTLNATIAVTGSGGSGSGLDATARVTNCQTSPPFSPPIFNCSAGNTGTLDFTPGGMDPGDIECSCVAPVVGVAQALLTCEEISPASTGTPAVRSWNLTCPGTAGQCGALNFTPPEGVVAFNNGSASIVVAHTGGTVGANTTFNACVVSGANAGSFSITNTPINFNFPGGASNQGTISLACTNATTTAVTANLSCNQVCDGTTPRNWTLSCPGQTAPPPTEEAVPVPTMGDLGRILMAAMLLLIGMGAVTIRSRG